MYCYLRWDWYSPFHPSHPPPLPPKKKIVHFTTILQVDLVWNTIWQLMHVKCYLNFSKSHARLVNQLSKLRLWLMFFALCLLPQEKVGTYAILILKNKQTIMQLFCSVIVRALRNVQYRVHPLFIWSVASLLLYNCVLSKAVHKCTKGCTYDAFFVCITKTHCVWAVLHTRMNKCWVYIWIACVDLR